MSSQVFHSWQLAQATTVSQHLIHCKTKQLIKIIDLAQYQDFIAIALPRGIGFDKVCFWLYVWSYIPCPVQKGKSPRRFGGSTVIRSSAMHPGLMKSRSCPVLQSVLKMRQTQQQFTRCQLSPNVANR